MNGAERIPESVSCFDGSDGVGGQRSPPQARRDLFDSSSLRMELPHHPILKPKQETDDDRSKQITNTRKRRYHGGVPRHEERSVGAPPEDPLARGIYRKQRCRWNITEEDRQMRCHESYSAVVLFESHTELAGGLTTECY
ncbi:hypothetical protein GW17_00042779 [Ensete ventricosum]|nr:hypothetical protein GW17_00042779 [Ensete ventricosum]RZS06884.1 hypothetical protein BHM03_00037639 [Ensete ventricosum]